MRRWILEFLAILDFGLGKNPLKKGMFLLLPMLPEYFNRFDVTADVHARFYNIFRFVSHNL